jgi:hypothetical protein
MSRLNWRVASSNAAPHNTALKNSSPAIRIRLLYVTPLDQLFQVCAVYSFTCTTCAGSKPLKRVAEALL